MVSPLAGAGTEGVTNLMLLRNPFPLIGALAALLFLWAGLFVSGTIIVLDSRGAISRAEEVNGFGSRPLRRLPFGLWAGLPHGDGTVRLVCSDGTATEHEYVTMASHVWLRVAKGGRCGRVGPI